MYPAHRIVAAVVVLIAAACCGVGGERASERPARADSSAVVAPGRSSPGTPDTPGNSARPAPDPHTTPLAAPPAAAEAGWADLLVSLVNDARRAQGLAPLAHDASLDRLAQRQAERMARAGRIFHNASLGSEMSRTMQWTEFGENVAVGPSIEDVHAELMDSAPHRAHILGGFSSLGVGVVRADRGGGYYVVEVFGTRPGHAGGS
jgi:uncharacterized protein YkwD